MKRLGLVASVASLSLLAIASPAAATVTVGQIDSGTPTSCSNSFEFVQRSTPDNSYVMPATGVITSWTHRSQSGLGQMPTLKIYRKVAEPARYQVVGHDSQPISQNTTKTFPASIPVKAGDLLGLTGAGGAVNIGCLIFGSSGNGEYGYFMGNLGDGASNDFLTGGGRLNVSATLQPTNTFTLGKVKRNEKKGTATLTAKVPNPGLLTGSGNGVKVASVARPSRTVSAPGNVKLKIRAKGQKKRQLDQTGKVKLGVNVTYTPTGGDPSTESKKVKLTKG